MCSAGDSAEVSQKYEQRRLTQQVKQPDLLAVWVKEEMVLDWIANLIQPDGPQ